MEDPHPIGKDFTVYKGTFGGPPAVPLTQAERDELFAPNANKELDTAKYEELVSLPIEVQQAMNDREPDEILDDMEGNTLEDGDDRDPEYKKSPKLYELLGEYQNIVNLRSVRLVNIYTHLATFIIGTNRQYCSIHLVDQRDHVKIGAIWTSGFRSPYVLYGRGAHRQLIRLILDCKGLEYMVVSNDAKLLESTLSIINFNNPAYADKIGKFPSYIGRYGDILQRTIVNIADYVHREPFLVAYAYVCKDDVPERRCHILYYPDVESPQDALKYNSVNKLNISIRNGVVKKKHMVKFIAARDELIKRYTGVFFVTLFAETYPDGLEYSEEGMDVMVPILEHVMPACQIIELFCGIEGEDSDFIGDDSDTECTDWLNDVYV